VGETTTTTIDLPEGVEIKPDPHGQGHELVWVDGVAMAIRGEGVGFEELELIAEDFRRTNALEAAEAKAESLLDSDRLGASRHDAAATAALLRDLVFEPLYDAGIVTDPDELQRVAWKCALAVSPLVAKFAGARQSELWLSTDQASEIEDGLLAEALDNAGRFLRLYSRQR
jgi:hypothetical protein